MSSTPDTLQTVVEKFVAAAAQPAVLDPGEEPLALIPGQWSVSQWSGRLVLEAWDARRNLVRKISGIKDQRRDRLSLLIERFPRTQGELQIADLAAPAGRELGRHCERIAFRDRLHLLLAREYPEWHIDDLSTEPNLEATLSPSWARAFLRLGTNGLAVMAAPPQPRDCAGIVPFGLIWLDYLRRREPRTVVRKLLLYVPAHREKEVALRASLLDPAVASCSVFAYDERGRVGEVDFRDIGNIESTLPPCRRPALPNSLNPQVDETPAADRVELSDGTVSLRVLGLEYGRITDGKLTCGFGRRSRATPETAIALSREVTRVRAADSEDPRHPLYLANPEGWLESLVREHPEAIDASLLPAPIYGQVPFFHGVDRSVVDLLGIDHTGRLAVIELKASADPELPFQALDYWVRVRRHLEAGDFSRLGYFPGQVIRPDPPRLLLVAPALEFHSTSETLIGFVSREIEMVRIGLAATWRRELQVMLRLRGAESPAAHDSSV